jgi:hypothetical protein
VSFTDADANEFKEEAVPVRDDFWKRTTPEPEPDVSEAIPASRRRRPTTSRPLPTGYRLVDLTDTPTI